MPTGGVTLDNISSWFDARAVAVGIGKNLIKSAGNDNYAEITDMSQKFVEKIKVIKV